MNTFSESHRIICSDMKINSSISNEKLGNYLFLRLIAKDKVFTNIKFTYSIFDNCYMRKCVFISCDFTGCKFIGSNFPSSTFENCSFAYTTFERTNITSEILDTGCPPFENQKQAFARTLRTNYQQIGDVESANKAIQVELQATAIHLYKEWNSNESYYRSKYKHFARINSFLKWVKFKILDFVWGNGESFVKIFRAIFLVIFFIALVDIHLCQREFSIGNLLLSLKNALSIFLGILRPEDYQEWYLAVIASIRLVSFGFLLSILIKRFNRR